MSFRTNSPDCNVMAFLCDFFRAWIMQILVFKDLYFSANFTVS